MKRSSLSCALLTAFWVALSSVPSTADTTLSGFEDIMAATVQNFNMKISSSTDCVYASSTWQCLTFTNPEQRTIPSTSPFLNLTSKITYPLLNTFSESTYLGDSASAATAAAQNIGGLAKSLCVAEKMANQWTANANGNVHDVDGSSSTFLPATPGTISTQYFANNQRYLSNTSFKQGSTVSDDIVVLKTFPANLGTWQNTKMDKSLACTNITYRAFERPWYNAASTTTPRDIVILIDMSAVYFGPTTMTDSTEGTWNANLRLGQIKSVAIALLNTLSWTDFVAVIPFHVKPDTSISPFMVRANMTNVASLITAVQALSIDGAWPSNLGLAVETAASLLNSGNTMNSSSATPGPGQTLNNCTRSIIVLGTGINAMPQPEPVKVYLRSGITNAIVFGFTFTPQVDSVAQAVQYMNGQQASIPVDQENITSVLAKSNQLAALTCASQGVFYVSYGSTIQPEEIAAKFNEFFIAAMLDTAGAPKWSEVYTDAFGQGKVASLSWPILSLDPRSTVMELYDSGLVSVPNSGKQLVGVLSMDVPLSNLTASLGSRGSSPASLDEIEKALLSTHTCRFPLNAQLSAAQAKVTRFSNSDRCPAPDSSPLNLIRYMWAVVLASIFLPQILMVPPAFIMYKMYRKRLITRALCGILFILWCICIPTFFGSDIYHSLSKSEGFISVDFKVISRTKNGYSCCSLACKYTEASSGVPSCSSALATHTEGECGDGSYSDDNDEFDNRQCFVSCSENCAVPTAVVSYEYQGLTIVSHIAQRCDNPSDATDCWTGFFANHSIGTTHVGLLDPRNPNIIVEEIDYNPTALVTVFFTGVLMLFIILLMWFIALSYRCSVTPEYVLGLEPNRSTDSSTAAAGGSSQSQSVSLNPVTAPAPINGSSSTTAASNGSSRRDRDEGDHLLAGPHDEDRSGPSSRFALIREALGETIRETLREARPPPPPYQARPLPPPAPQSEHTLGLPEIRYSEGNLPPPPPYSES